MTDRLRKSSAAERFYHASHERSLAAGGSVKWSADSKIEGLREMSKPGHRYYCVYEHLSRQPNQTLVELGFGSPALIESMAAMCNQFTIVDIVDRTQSLSLPSNICLETADLNEPFPFEDARFDCVVAMMVVEHLFDPFHAFEEIARILRTGGHAFVNVPNIASIKCRLQLLSGKMPVTSTPNWFDIREWDGNHLHYFTVNDVVRTARLYGLKLVRLFPVGKMVAVKRMMPTLLCHEISFAFIRTD
jgi:SAM-dependent methyltransferase